MTFDADNPAFDEDSRPVESVDFDYPDEADAPEPCATPPDVNQFLLALLDCGHFDSLPVRLAAMATITGAHGWATISEAARRLGVTPSAVSRARKAIIRELSAMAELRKLRASIGDSPAA